MFIFWSTSFLSGQDTICRTKLQQLRGIITWLFKSQIIKLMNPSDDIISKATTHLSFIKTIFNMTKIRFDFTKYIYYILSQGIGLG